MSKELSQKIAFPNKSVITSPQPGILCVLCSLKF